MFYPFQTLMQRADVLKEVTLSHALPKDLTQDIAGTDIL
jgi:hypothetical protein